MMTGTDNTRTSRPASMTPPNAMPKPPTLPVTTPPSTPPLTSRKARKAMPKMPSAKNTPTMTSCPAWWWKPAKRSAMAGSSLSLMRRQTRNMPAPNSGTSRWAAIWPNSGTMEMAIRMTRSRTVTPIQIPGLTRNMAHP